VVRRACHGCGGFHEELLCIDHIHGGGTEYQEITGEKRMVKVAKDEGIDIQREVQNPLAPLLPESWIKMVPIRSLQLYTKPD